jgi:hypothetical protein
MVEIGASVVVAAATPRCPVCGSAMVRRRARKGANAGNEFWGCTRFRIDECPGTRDIAPEPARAVVVAEFSQARYERKKRAHQRLMHAVFPTIVAISSLTGLGAVALLVPYIGPWAGSVALPVFVVAVFALTRLPSEALYWDKGARGERRSAEVLDPLGQQGFVIQYNRLMPDGRGDIDAIAIGPTGVWVIETKNLTGTVEVVRDRLFVKDHDRQAMVEQVYREAFAVQQIVGDLLASAVTMVVPVLCIHGARTPRFDRTVGGVRLTSGGSLASLLTSGLRKLDPDLVQEIAKALDRKLREPWSWEEDQ